MKKKKPADSKAWASFRIRGIQTTLKALSESDELSIYIIHKLGLALKQIDLAVDKLDEERKANEAGR